MMMITGLITRLMGDFPLIHNIYITQYLGINLTKELKALYLENYRTLKREIEEDTNKWKHITYSWTRRINIIKMFILLKTIYRLNAILIKIPLIHFTDLEEIFQKFI